MLLAVLALMGVALVAGAAAHTVKYDSTVTAKFKKEGKDPATDPATFSGTVDSAKARCKTDRKVNLRIRTGDGSSTQVATAQTDSAGRWEIKQASFAAGTYFAQAGKKVLRKNSNHRHICKKAVSADVTVK